MFLPMKENNNLQYVNCNICGFDETHIITIQNGYKVVKCKKCNLVYVNPRLTQKAITELYNDYHQRNGKDEHTWALLMRKNFEDTSAMLNRMFPEKGKLLDVGCGYGHFIEIMNNYGWSAIGIDPSSKTIDYAKQKKLVVMETTIDDAEFPDSFFDAVTAFYVLEHLIDPLAALKKIFMMLKAGGVLVLRVPYTTPIVKLFSFLSIKNNLYDLPYHLYDFSPRTINLLLEKAGFSSRRVIPGRPTLPQKYKERIISITSSTFSRFLFSISIGKILLPGVSTTIIASKSLDKGMKVH